MANGYFERGEVYWVRMDTMVGGEMGLSRPAVIISQNEYNNSSPTVFMAYLSTKEHKIWEVPTMATGRDSYIKCNQLFTIDKSRIGKFMGVLDRAETRELNDVLEKFLDLGYDDTVALNAKDTEIAALKVEIARLEGELTMMKNVMDTAQATYEKNLEDAKFETLVQTKLYERCLEKLVKMRLGADIQACMRAEATIAEEKPVMKPVAVVAPVVEKAEEDTEATEERVDVNHCTATQLKKIGFSMPMAKVIVSKRPYKSVDDLRNLPGMKASLFRLKAPKLCVIVDPEPVVEESVAPVVEEQPVVVKSALVDPDPGYEVEPVVVAEEPIEVTPVIEKVNVNTASAVELHEQAGLSMTSAYGITGYRKKYGEFKSLDELLYCPRMTQKILTRYRGKLTV